MHPSRGSSRHLASLAPPQDQPRIDPRSQASEPKTRATRPRANPSGASARGALVAVPSEPVPLRGQRAERGCPKRADRNPRGDTNRFERKVAGLEQTLARTVHPILRMKTSKPHTTTRGEPKREAGFRRQDLFFPLVPFYGVLSERREKSSTASLAARAVFGATPTRLRASWPLNASRERKIGKRTSRAINSLLSIHSFTSQSHSRTGFLLKQRSVLPSRRARVVCLLILKRAAQLS